MVVVVKVGVMFWVVLMVESGRGQVWSGLVGSDHGWVGSGRGLVWSWSVGRVRRAQMDDAR